MTDTSPPAVADLRSPLLGRAHEQALQHWLLAVQKQNCAGAVRERQNAECEPVRKFDPSAVRWGIGGAIGVHMSREQREKVELSTVDGHQRSVGALDDSKPVAEVSKVGIGFVEDRKYVRGAGREVAAKTQRNLLWCPSMPPTLSEQVVHLTYATFSSYFRITLGFYGTALGGVDVFRAELSGGASG